MKISQYNWNVWFLTNLLLLAVIMVAGMCISDSKTEDAIIFKNIVVYGTPLLAFSLIPCLYIGCKPLNTED